MMTSDLDLLRQYALGDSQEAFTALVHRHLDLVYSAALRQVRSPQLAEEVAQSVFTDLSRNVRKLKPDTILTAWLYQVTRRTAVDVIRRESRRQLREQIASEMNAMDSHADSGTGFQPVWADIEPHFDEAMESLDETDRSALLLRYFERKSLREVGTALGTSEDAAQKRVSRAVERLREFFSKRGVAVGASGLVVVISANAIQAAPVGLAVTISTAAAIAGATLATTATATATKAIAMTTLQKTVIAVTLAAAVGTGIYEARQASMWRAQVQTLQQQQARLADQIEQLQRERDEATRQLLALRAENERLNRNTDELPRLRGEVARLRNDVRVPQQTNTTNSSMDAAAKSWLNRAEQLKQYAERNPNEKISEFLFLTDGDWLSAASNGGTETDDFETKRDETAAMERLRLQAENRFAHLVQGALRKHSSANNGQFPTVLSQLTQYCEPVSGEVLQQLYEIKPKNTLPESEIKDLTIKAEWLITRKQPVNSNSTTRLAIFPFNTVYWQTSP